MEKPLITSCLSPIIVDVQRGQKQMVKCGKCVACLNAKASRNQRLCELEQLGAFSYCYFVTLTYSDDYLPVMEIVPSDDYKDTYSLLDCCDRSKRYGQYSDDVKITPKELAIINQKTTTPTNKIGYLLYRDIELFNKRLRKQVKKHHNEELRYFVAGEYGPKTLRPHWHIIYFSKTPLNVRGKKPIFTKWNIRQVWKKGRVDADRTKGGANSYTASYINSRAILPNVYNDVKISCVTRHSIKLGHEAMQKLYSNQIDEVVSDEINRRKEILATYVVDGHSKRLPLDPTYKNQHLCKSFRFDLIASDQSLLQYVRCYNHYAEYFRHIGFNGVKNLTRLVLDYLTSVDYEDLTEYDKTFIDLVKIDVSPIGKTDMMLFDKTFNRLYRFFLYSKKFGQSDIHRVSRYYDVVEYSMLCQQYDEQIKYADNGGKDFTLFYDTTFSIKLLKEQVQYHINRENQENIHNKKLLRKRMNDLAGMLNPENSNP